MKTLNLARRLGVAAAIIAGAVMAAPSQAQTIKADGSSTVGPITQAVAEEYQEKNPGVNITVGISGTGGGFKKFIAGETDISDASRPIKAGESSGARDAGIGYIELPVAYDAITIVVSQQNTWCKNLTKAELKKIWEPGSKVNNWSQVRAGFPSRPLRLYGPGTASGTFDYFTEAINGKEKACRSDYSASEDDNVLVQGVSRDAGALGYFGLAYYEENKSKLNAVTVDGIAPSAATVINGKYQPLSRPLFIYVKKSSATKPAVASFVRFYLQNSARLSRKVGYVGLPSSISRLATQRFNKKTTGSLFAGKGAVVGVRLGDLLRKESAGH